MCRIEDAAPGIKETCPVFAPFRPPSRTPDSKSRLWRMPPLLYSAPPWRASRVAGGFGSPSLRLGAVKGYADGSLGSETAYFFDPYTDDPKTHGLLSDEMHPASAMRRRNALRSP